MWFMEEPKQFSVGKTAQSLTCTIMEKPHAGLGDCLNMLLSCFRKRMSAWAARWASSMKLSVEISSASDLLKRELIPLPNARLGDEAEGTLQ